MMDQYIAPKELENLLFRLYKRITFIQPAFCVDGRRKQKLLGKNLYPQILGGVYHFGVLEYILDPEEINYQSPEEGIENGIKKAKKNKIPIGIHGDHHKGELGCGFGSRLEEILQKLGVDADNIWVLIENASPDLSTKKEIWDRVINKLRTKIKDRKIPNGSELAQMAKRSKAKLQILDGDHGEIAAVVNLVNGTTLDKNQSNDNLTQAFNLDIWYVQEKLMQMQWREELIDEAFIISLGLFVATERVLRENKPPLPVLVKKR